MKHRYIYIFSGLVILLVSLNRISLGQETLADTVTTQTLAEDSPALDTLSGKSSQNRNRFEISVDYLKLVSLAFPNELKMEGSMGYISRFNIGINAEFGYGEKTPDDFYKNAEYKVYGYYGRIGVSYYYPYNPGVNFIIGAKYAMSQYQDEADFAILSSMWDDYHDSFERTDLNANWAELVLGSESSVKGNLYFGFYLRFRILIEADNFDLFEVYSVPGYGRTFDNFVPVLNLYIKYLIPFGKGG